METVTRDEKGIMLRLLGAGGLTERPASRTLYKAAMSRLMARGFVVNRRWGYFWDGGRRSARNNYVLTATGMARAARLAFRSREQPRQRQRTQKKPPSKLRPHYDSYGKATYL